MPSIMAMLGEKPVFLLSLSLAPSVVPYFFEEGNFNSGLQRAFSVHQINTVDVQRTQTGQCYTISVCRPSPKSLSRMSH